MRKFSYLSTHREIHMDGKIIAPPAALDTIVGDNFTPYDAERKRAAARMRCDTPQPIAVLQPPEPTEEQLLKERIEAQWPTEDDLYALQIENKINELRAAQLNDLYMEATCGDSGCAWDRYQTLAHNYRNNEES